MSGFLQRIAGYSPKRLALLANELKERVDALEEAAHEPIAIVGLACRFPGGADTPELFWDLVRRGADTITETDPKRWSNAELYDRDPDAPGKLASPFGSYLSRIDGFDAGLFGIAHREAQHMDPQQRLLLEVTWEALENAGIAPDSLTGAPAGVFVGMSSFDYYTLMRADTHSLDAYSASGVAHSIASGRLAYVLGTRGPAISIDTACSSSLVSTHLAVQSLRTRQCEIALSAGVNLLLTPDTTISLSKAHMLAPDGRCKAFDARADGFVRGEGCGVLVLKRLRDALAARDPIVAVIRGSASNQDGRSNGLTAPSGTAQEALLRAALADARMDAAAIGYVEAHGTGTKLGDPIEALSLHAVYGVGRDHAAPLSIGSVKANVGHLESAAGVAGVIKLALALQHGIIPKQPHFETPNPHIPWDDLRLAVPRQAQAWLGPRVGGVSSFGFSGTNAHLVLEESPSLAVVRTTTRPLEIITASARTDAALNRLLESYAAALSVPGTRLEEAAHAANTGKAHLTQRAAVVAATPEAAAAALAQLARGEAPAGARRGSARPRAPKVAFLFTGQGAQYAGMGKELDAAHPAFAAALDRCDQILRDLWAGGALRDVLNGSEARLEDTTYAQPALFALEFALAELWMSWGVQPAAVMGHSLGELVAACIAGMISLEEALRFAVVRGRLMGALPRGGAMAAMMADEAEVTAAVMAHGGTVSIAAFNGARNTVISGAAQDVESISTAMRRKGVTVTPLKVSHAFHSQLMEPMLEGLVEEAAQLGWCAPQIELVSNVTGMAIGAVAPPASYWREHARSPVRFSQSIQTLRAAGYTTFVEIGPHPTLIAMAQADAVDTDVLWMPSLRRGASDHATLMNSLTAFYVAGGDVNWEQFDAPFPVRPMRLPNYPFEHEKFWVETALPQSAVRATEDAASARVARMLYEVTWKRAQPVSTSEIAAALAPTIDAAVVEKSLDAYASFAQELDRLSGLYVVAVLRKLGWNLALGSMATRDLPARLAVLPRHGRLFLRMLAILEEDGLLKKEGEVWRVVSSPSGEDAEALAEALALRYPDCQAELRLTQRCARSLAEVMRGECDPLELLFPDGSIGDLEQLYQFSPPARFYNALVAEAVATIAPSAGGRPLRILEIGAGTGSTTAAVVARLAGTPYEYTFTDVSPLFLERSKEKFATQRAMRFAVLDLERDPAEQGFAAGSYDVVIGANVAHATRDLGLTCARLRGLLASDGRLVLLEAMGPQRFGDLTVGMLDGWWAFTDTQRRTYALMPREAWRAVMMESGFKDVAAVPSLAQGGVFDKQAVLVATPESAAPRRWLIAPDTGGFATLLAGALRANGRAVTVLDADPETAARQISDVKEPIGLVALQALDSESGSPQRMIESALAMIHALGRRSAAAKLCFVTRGGQAVRGDERVVQDQALLWGLSHVVAIEHAELGCSRIDLDPASNAVAAAETLAAELCADACEDQVAFRGGTRLVRRLSRRRPHTATPMPIDPASAYLVTGGLRGLGVLVGEWLVDQGARTVALMGRSAPGESAGMAIKRMEEKGARVLVCRGDVAVRGDVHRVFEQMKQTGAPVGGVFHCAGVLDDGVLTAQTWERFATVLEPKVQGALNLHELCGDAPLVFFASGASVAGSAGQANHAAANAFEDALAWRRQAEGKPGLSINWGPWAEVGAAAEREVNSVLLRPLAPVDGLVALSACLSRDATGLFRTAQIAVFDAEWKLLSELPGYFGSSPLFSELAEESKRLTQQASVSRAPSTESDWRARIFAGPEHRRNSQLRDEVRALVANVLGAPVASVGFEAPLRELGLDSLMAVELRNRLGKAVGTVLPATVTFDHPTVAQLTRFLLDESIFGLTSDPSGSSVPKGADETDPYRNQSEAEVAAALAARLDTLQL
jgi:acyl transferase domain-containing protein/SAM-dependent methyltransferase/acyl carrier protein